MTKTEEIKDASKKAETLALSQAKKEDKKQLEKLPMLEKQLLTLVCLYSLIEAKLIGPILAKLMSEFEGEEYSYYELLADRILNIKDKHLYTKESKKKQNPLNIHCQYIIAKEKVMLNYNYQDKTVHQMEDEQEAFIIHESTVPLEVIPLFNRGDYLFKVRKYQRYPYILDFLDYVISKKAKAYQYNLNTFPVYSEKELYRYLKEYLEINLLKIREKEQIEQVVKRLVLKNDIA